MSKLRSYKNVSNFAIKIKCEISDDDVRVFWVQPGDLLEGITDDTFEKIKINLGFNVFKEVDYELPNSWKYQGF